MFSEKALQFFGADHPIFPTDDIVMDHKGFDASLQYLKSVFNVKELNLLCALCNNQPFHIQRILSLLEFDIATAVAPEHKLLRLFHFALCMDEIGNFLVHAEDKICSNFFIENCIHFLCNRISHSSGDLLVTLSNYFYFFSEQYIVSHVGVFKNKLSFIINSLIHKFIEVENSNEQDGILRVLDQFLVDHHELFKDATKLLPEMPDHSKLSHLNANTIQAMDTDTVDLQQEIDQFNSMAYVSCESLSSLAFNLSMCKNQLVDIFAIAGTIKNSEDSHSSRLHRLVAKLLTIIQNDNGDEPKKPRMAAKCLGELGASDLSVETLISQKEVDLAVPLSKLATCAVSFYGFIMRKLPEALFDANANVKMAATSIALNIVQSKIGKVFSNSFNFISNFI